MSCCYARHLPYDLRQDECPGLIHADTQVLMHGVIQPPMQVSVLNDMGGL